MKVQSLTIKNWDLAERQIERYGKKHGTGWVPCADGVAAILADLERAAEHTDHDDLRDVDTEFSLDGKNGFICASARDIFKRNVVVKIEEVDLD